LRSLESYGDFFLGQQLISFVHENYCNCSGWRVVRLQNGVVLIWTLKNWNGTSAMPHKWHRIKINWLFWGEHYICRILSFSSAHTKFPNWGISPFIQLWAN
jgi:hypothetical protein